MDSKFAALTESLHGSFERLVASEPCLPGHKWPRERLAGVYLFSESGRTSLCGANERLSREVWPPLQSRRLAPYGRVCFQASSRGNGPDESDLPNR